MMEVTVTAKFARVSALLERRVRHGDYLLKDFPTDRQLAAEFGVDTRTARKAVAKLIDAGLLVRQANGRPAICRVAHREVGTLRIAMLSVAYPSPYTWRWMRVIGEAAAARGWMFRPVTYTHVEDPVVADTLDGFDGVFFGLPGVDPTEHLLRTVTRPGRPVVFLDADLSAHGLPSLWLSAPSHAADRLMAHLEGLGHQRVACLNTQPHNAVTDARIAAWRAWSEERGMAGALIDEPVESFGSPVERAYQTARAALCDGRAGLGGATALLCCTAAAAKGVYRAAHECGLRIGPDLAVCAADDGAGDAPFFVPSLTSIRDPDPTPYVEQCLDWLAAGGQDWRGPLLTQPADVPLFVGESTAAGGATTTTTATTSLAAAAAASIAAGD